MFTSDMSRKKAVIFSEKFLDVDLLALRLLQKLLAFDPMDRSSVE